MTNEERLREEGRANGLFEANAIFQLKHPTSQLINGAAMQEISRRGWEIRSKIAAPPAQEAKPTCAHGFGADSDWCPQCPAPAPIPLLTQEEKEAMKFFSNDEGREFCPDCGTKDQGHILAALVRRLLEHREGGRK